MGIGCICHGGCLFLLRSIHKWPVVAGQKCFPSSVHRKWGLWCPYHQHNCPIIQRGEQREPSDECQSVLELGFHRSLLGIENAGSHRKLDGRSEKTGKDDWAVSVCAVTLVIELHFDRGEMNLSEHSQSNLKEEFCLYCIFNYRI